MACYSCKKQRKRGSSKSKNIFIDVGAANKEEVESLGIHVGTVVTFEDEIFKLNKNIGVVVL